MNLRNEIERLLPTKTAKWTASLTIPLLPPLFAAPHILSPLAPAASEAEIILAQILLPTMIALIGTLVILSSVLHAYHTKSETPVPDTSTRLDDTKEKIVLLLASSKRQTEKQVANSLGISEQLAIFHLNELFSSHYITNTLSMSGDPIQWSIQQNGRAYLVAHELLK